MPRQSTITYDSIHVGTVEATSITVESLNVDSVISFPVFVGFNNVSITDNLDVGGSIVGTDASFNNLVVSNAVFNNIQTQDITATNAIRYPVSVISPVGPETIITLSNDNSGNIIDANTPSQQYVISLGFSLEEGNRWEVYVNSEDLIIFRNNTERPILSSGIVHIDDGTGSTYEYVPPTLLPVGASGVQPGNKAKYVITVSTVSTDQVRIAFDAIFIVQA